MIYLIVLTSFVALLPEGRIKRGAYYWSALTAFRILARSFSAVIAFHNKHLRPGSDGICVANHTTPIDVVILSVDNAYAMVSYAGGRDQQSIGIMKVWDEDSFRDYESLFQVD